MLWSIALLERMLLPLAAGELSKAYLLSKKWFMIELSLVVVLCAAHEATRPIDNPHQQP